MHRSSLSGAAAAVLSAAALTLPPPACTAQESLVPGARAGDCRSALQVGIVACRAMHGAVAPGARAATEAQVDAVLQQWGKPPREAVRALLDPTDENILAWIGSQRRTLSVARYVATRMTELQAQAPGREPNQAATDPVTQAQAQ
jgi:hypothetical protein